MCASANATTWASRSEALDRLAADVARDRRMVETAAQLDATAQCGVRGHSWTIAKVKAAAGSSAEARAAGWAVIRAQQDSKRRSVPAAWRTVRPAAGWFYTRNMPLMPARILVQRCMENRYCPPVLNSGRFSNGMTKYLIVRISALL